MLVEAHAKINFTLQVLGKRPDGYHDLRSIVLPVPLHDDVHIDEAREVMVPMRCGARRDVTAAPQSGL